MLAGMSILPENGPLVDLEKSYATANPDAAKKSVRGSYKLHYPAFMLTHAGTQKRQRNGDNFPILPPYNPTPPYKN